MSKFIVLILIVQAILCVLCAISFKQFYDSVVSKQTFLPKAIISPTADAALSYFTYMLLLNTMIPISLIISLEMVKLIQGYFISVDCEMYSEVRDK
jgi:magnesium-transporting ATPase (P-type)